MWRRVYFLPWMAAFCAGLFVCGCPKPKDTSGGGPVNLRVEAAKAPAPRRPAPSSERPEEPGRVGPSTERAAPKRPPSAPVRNRRPWTQPGKLDLTGLGLEIYPGAKQEGGADITSKRSAVLSVKLRTPDSFEQVAQFYKTRYPKARSQERVTQAQKTLTLQVSASPDLRTIVVMRHADAEVTTITLLRHRTSATH